METAETDHTQTKYFKHLLHRDMLFIWPLQAKWQLFWKFFREIFLGHVIMRHGRPTP